MNGYSKIRGNTNFTVKSRSVDFSDLTFSPPQTLENSCPDPHPTSKAQEDRSISNIHEQLPGVEECGDSGERFGVILSRNFSSASQRFRVSEKNRGGTLQAVVKRAFSMRKPPSVSEGYWRIHDTGDGEGEGNGDIDGDMMQQQQQQMRSPKRKRGKILRACKRLFGF